MSKQTISPQNRNLTAKFSVHQAVYWAGYAGVYSFAVAYLLEKGFSTMQIGWLLFGANLASALLQPFLANYADKATKNVIPRLLILLTSISLLCFLSICLFAPPLLLFALLYLVGVLCLDIVVPLLNSISVYYQLRSWKLNYGVGRGIGAAGFSLASLGFGYLMAKFGADTMPIVAILCMVVCILLSASYPKDNQTLQVEKQDYGEATSLWAFLSLYRWYCLSLFGVLFLAMFHAMSENYLIEVIKPFGGNSSHVGTALFIATAVEIPTMMLFSRIHQAIGSYKVLLIAGLCYFAKAILFLLAGSIPAIYALQLLQCLTYVMLSPVQVYYGKECTKDADMVKGQSFITAFYSLGCALGNLFGGLLLAAYDVRFMLYCGAGMALAGLLLLIVFVPKAQKAIA